MKKPLYCSLVVAAGLMLMCMGCQANSQSSAAGAPNAPTSPGGQTLHGQALSGTVQSYNVDMNGMYASMNIMQSDGRAVQVNFPAAVGPTVAKSVNVGDHVSVTALPRLSMPDHPVYAIESLTAKGKNIDVSHKAGPGQAHVQGKIAHFNYDRQGRMNGVVLSSGETVLIAPRIAQHMDLQLGQDFRADGRIRPAMGGNTIIMAGRINGVPIPRPMAMKPGAGRFGRHHHHHRFNHHRGMWQRGPDGRGGFGPPWGMHHPGMGKGGPDGRGGFGPPWGMHRPGMDGKMDGRMYGNGMKGGGMDGGGMPPRFGPQGHRGPRPTTGPANWHGGASGNSHSGDQTKGGGSNEPANPNGMGQ